MNFKSKELQAAFEETKPEFDLWLNKLNEISEDIIKLECHLKLSNIPSKLFEIHDGLYIRWSDITEKLCLYSSIDKNTVELDNLSSESMVICYEKLPEFLLFVRDEIKN